MTSRTLLGNFHIWQLNKAYKTVFFLNKEFKVCLASLGH